METTLGQFSSTSCVTVFRICPLFKGKRMFDALWAVSNKYRTVLPLCWNHCAWCSVPRHTGLIPCAEFWPQCHVIPSRRRTFHIAVLVWVVRCKVSTEMYYTGGALTCLSRFHNRGRLFDKGCSLQHLWTSIFCAETIPLDFFFWRYIENALSCSYPCSNITIQINTEEYTDILFKHHLIPW